MLYGGNTKYHSNPYIQGTTVPCDGRDKKSCLKFFVGNITFFEFSDFPALCRKSGIISQTFLHYAGRVRLFLRHSCIMPEEWDYLSDIPALC